MFEFERNVSVFHHKLASQFARYPNVISLYEAEISLVQYTYVIS